MTPSVTAEILQEQLAHGLGKTRERKFSWQKKILPLLLANQCTLQQWHNSQNRNSSSSLSNCSMIWTGAAAFVDQLFEFLYCSIFFSVSSKIWWHKPSFDSSQCLIKKGPITGSFGVTSYTYVVLESLENIGQKHIALSSDVGCDTLGGIQPMEGPESLVTTLILDIPPQSLKDNSNVSSTGFVH